MKLYAYIFVASLMFQTCGGDNTGSGTKVPEPAPIKLVALKVDGVSAGFDYTLSGNNPEIEITFSADIDRATVPAAVKWTDKDNKSIEWEVAFRNNDSAMIIQSKLPLDWLSKYTLSVSDSFQSKSGGSLRLPIAVNLTTWIDATDKFPRISDEDLLNLVQKQTFGYFWDGAEPTSGLARERYHSDDIYPQNDKNVVTSGGSGFGIMAMISAIETGYITREQGLERFTQIMNWLEKADRFHGAFPHWWTGETGKVKPFSQYDDGGDLVETAYLFQGLLSLRQYYKNGNEEEKAIAARIDKLWREVEFDWYRNGQNVLYWHWSPQYEWKMNFPVKGWNECLIVYILAAASPTHGVPAEVYHEGWAQSGKLSASSEVEGYPLQLFQQVHPVGPLFWEHYSFLGLDPRGLKDRYGDYWTENVNQTLINRAYCIRNPKGYKGYGADCWGLTSGYSIEGYAGHAPYESADLGVISPTAALSSIVYTPEYSMDALRYFYYTLGDRIWGKYGFYDAFSMTDDWFPQRYLAIDQGPIPVMIENHRSELLWNLFMSHPDVQSGLRKLDFESPHLK